MQNYKSREFKNGDVIKAIYFENDESLEIERDCDFIIVVMENGQMAGVPWFEVWKDDKILSKWNAASVQGIAYKQD